MARQKTSQAKIYHARLNPINERERKAMEIIEQWEQQDVNFKQLVVDRVLRCEGYTPEMFDAPANNVLTAEKLESLLNSFADEIVRHVKSGSPAVDRRGEANDDDEEDSVFARNFTRGFMRRQQQGTGDDDE